MPVTISSNAIEVAVDRLLAARRERTPLSGLPADGRPAAVEDGYAIQDAFIAAYGLPVAGWKVGATAEAPQRLFGVSEPFYGPVFGPVVRPSPAHVERAAFQLACIECEFAFRLAHELPPVAAPRAPAEVAAAVGAVVPAIELVDTRLDDLTGYGAPSAIADCAVNGGLVLGTAFGGWRDLDLPNHVVRLTVDGEPIAEGRGAAVLGDPLNALTWFVNHRNGRGHTVPAGQVVSTGSCTGVTMIEAGQTAVGDFGPLGQVSVCYRP